MIIYQVFTRLFGANKKSPVPNGSAQENGCGKMADFTKKALDEIALLGATHIWYTGIIEHATQTDYSLYGIAKDHPEVVKGRAGSPYAIKDYYDVDPDLATSVPERMHEFQNLVNRTHKSGLGVIIDFVPNHVAREYHSDVCPDECQDLGAGDDPSKNYSPNNNFYYLGEPLHLDNILQDSEFLTSNSELYSEDPAKATGNDVFHAWPGRSDWYETVKLNYGPNTRKKMLQILLFWASKGIDGFRCDMAEMVPVDFWEWVIPQVKAQYPKIIFIAEVYNPSLYREYIYRGHFDYLYDKVGLYDKLKAVICGWASPHEITQCWQDIDDIQPHMLNFLENHDEQRLASDFFAGEARKGKPALVTSTLMNTNPFMVYFGQELGERGMDNEGFSGRDGRTTIFDYWTVDTIRRWRNGGCFDGSEITAREEFLRLYYQTIFNLAEKEDVFSKGDFYDLMYVNHHLTRQYTFLRHYRHDICLVVANFSDQDITVDINIPEDVFKLYGLNKSTTISMTNLLTGEKVIVPFTCDAPTPVNVKAWDSVILKNK